jgi:hypothetical protein
MVLGLQHAIADHAPDRGGTDGQRCGRFVDRHLTTLAAFAFAVRRDLLAMTTREQQSGRFFFLAAGRNESMAKDAMTQANSSVEYPKLAEVRPLVVAWSTLAGC